MSIYKKRSAAIVYRKIYEEHYGSIPKDNYGRSYDIHHLDGDHSNNNPQNLKAVSIQEHYDIHHAQNDWGACYAITLRMAVTVETRRELSKKFNQDRVKNGTHPWQKKEDGSSTTGNKAKNGTHPMMGIGKKHHSHNPTIFLFVHDDGRTHLCTCYDLRDMYPSICKKQLSSLIHGNKKSVRGWRISSE